MQALAVLKKYLRIKHMILPLEMETALKLHSLSCNYLFTSLTSLAVKAQPLPSWEGLCDL